MHDARFFQTTRGKIVAALRRRRSASAVDLADEFGLSANAVRQQLLALERDGYVVERSVRRGPTKPTLEFSLTGAADGLFPQRYDRMLSAVLREVKAQYGDRALGEILEKLGQRATERFRRSVRSVDTRSRAAEVAEVLRRSGVEADVAEGGDGTLELREHNCPYGKTVGEHPEVCGIITTVLRETVAAGTIQLESIATGGDVCRFEIPIGAPHAAPSGVRS